MTESSFHHTFPAVRGIQAGRPCYIAMCPMRIIPKLFVFDEDEVPPELRAQRTLNKSRIPELTSYLTNNSRNYTLSSLTASIDANVIFEPIQDTGIAQNIGSLSIPMESHILINDGQHRRAAIEEAIKENPELAHDNISVLFFIDEGLSRSQQMFADLNKHAIRPSDSISTLYDLRDSISELGRDMQKKVHIFSRLTEMEKSTISNRSTKLFTLSSIKNATKALLRKNHKDHISKDEKDLAIAFWNEVASNMIDWQLVLEKKVSTSDLREQYIHAHGVLLQALGQIGSDMLLEPVSTWKKQLKKLNTIDWSRSNSDWESRALVHGKVSKQRTSVILTGNYIKKHLRVPLNPQEEDIEKGFSK